MVQLLVALAILWAIIYGSKVLARSNPAQVRTLTKAAGGWLALAAALFLLLRGQIEIALGVGGLGAWLLGWSAMPKWGPLQMFSGSGAGRTRSKTARTRRLEFDIADQGILGGRVTAGPFAGADLAALDPAQCEALLAACVGDDPDGARLLDAYLDRRFPGRRAAREGEGDPRGRPARPGAMSEKEAYEILGLAPQAGRDDVSRAHRTLMKKLHPDYGGSTGLAARINEARDVLLHRQT